VTPSLRVNSCPWRALAGSGFLAGVSRPGYAVKAHATVSPVPGFWALIGHRVRLLPLSDEALELFGSESAHSKRRVDQPRAKSDEPYHG
jgi:hypothetical protein